MSRHLAAAAALALLPGCAMPLVSGGSIREAPYRDLWRRTAELHGDDPSDPVAARVIEQAHIPALIREIFREEWTARSLADYQESLVAAGVWPADRDLTEEWARLSATELAGFYAPDRQTLYVVAEIDESFTVRVLSVFARRDLAREATLSHEIVHALQHRAHPALFDDAQWKTQDDVGFAAQVALEGDALLYEFLVVLQGGEPPEPGPVRENLRLTLGSEERLARAPALLRLALPFPYVEGYPLAYAERAALLEDPPASTEQVLHPDRRRADFLAIDLAGLAAALPRGCRPLFENTLGEFGTSVLFQDLSAGAAPVPSEVWDGWDGDRYLAALCGERRELFWVTAWDSEDDAREFADAYEGVAAAAAARADFSAPARAARRGREVWVASPGLAAWLGAERPPGRRARVSTPAELHAHFEGTP